MAQQPIAAATSEIPDPLGSATFRSILPTLDAILDVLYAQSRTEEPSQGVEASAHVAQKARELASALDEMRKAAMALPGGNYSIENIQHMSAVLEVEAEKRRTLLRAFGEKEMPIVDELINQGRNGEESVMPSPATRNLSEQA